MVSAHEAKKDYSLAYNRASAVLRKRNEEEFRNLVKVFLNNIKVEREMLGGVTTDQAPLKHVPDETGEVCVECGQQVPCRAQRDRENKLRIRERERERQRDYSSSRL